ncbi:MAG TPA: single-stranded-DNA-specific exonuclease RecJ [Solirubrobacterales bacterium]|nr:single-stranded-DNA-specific exonuclease RecJ [Solirubrobacterales bacterium]
MEEALSLARELDLKLPVATALVRRGHRSPAEARAFLAADETHDPSSFEGMDEVVDLVTAAIDGGRRITVYGDFDVDGVASTSILVGLFRHLGADADWFIPDRIADGYGLNDEAIRTIAGRGTDLVITVDCGVTAVSEVALARELGMRIVVTDHHQPGPELPDCPILHPEICGYPFKQLCGAAVAWKLASAIRRERGLDPALDVADLDLVALATVADVMPLIGENRRLVKEGVRVARRAERIGMRALLDDARVTPARLTSEDFGFRLGPRINAAGRMYRADAGVELFLADSAERAAEIGEELGRANLDRRRVEREVENEAEAARRELEDPEAPALVVAGEGWHPGVVGIVASRLARKYEVPAVVIATGDEVARGSARSVPGLDLHRAIMECADLLEGFGGHKAAAGIQIRPERIEPFRRALAAAVVDQIGLDPPSPKLPVDAIVGGEEVGLPLAEEIEKLEPFGQGNRPLTLLVPGARICDVREIGEGKHARFSLNSGGHRAAGICFGRTSFGVGEDDPVDVAAELSVNHWNGSVEPQVRLEEVFPVRITSEGVRNLDGCAEDEWWRRFEYAHEAPPSTPVPAVPGTRTPAGVAGLPGVRIADLISSGESVAIGTADGHRRWLDLGGEPGLGRFREGAEILGLWPGSPEAAVERARAGMGSGVLVFDLEMLEAQPDLVAPFSQVVALDPPYSAQQAESLKAGKGLLHAVQGAAEIEFAEKAVAHRFDLTAQLRDLFLKLRDADQVRGELLRSLLSGPSETPRSPELAARMVRILQEVDLVQSEGRGDARTLGVVSSEKVELEDSPVFVRSRTLCKEHLEFLKQSKRSTS